jgi:hypothetical protein
MKKGIWLFILFGIGLSVFAENKKIFHIVNSNKVIEVRMKDNGKTLEMTCPKDVVTSIKNFNVDSTVTRVLITDGDFSQCDFNFLENLSSARVLIMTGSYITNFDFLQKLPNLEAFRGTYIKKHGTKTEELDLSNYKRLTYFDLAGPAGPLYVEPDLYQIKKIQHVNLNLKNLSLSSQNIEDISNFPQLVSESPSLKFGLDADKKKILGDSFQYMVWKDYKDADLKYNLMIDVE